MDITIGNKTPKEKNKKEDLVKKPAVEPTDSNSNEIPNIIRRLRMIDETNSNLRKRIQVTDQNMILNTKKLVTETKAISSDIIEIKAEIEKINEKIIQIAKELRESAKSEEVKIIKKYLDYWQPVKFVTQGEIDYIIEEALNQKLGKLNKG